MKPPPFQPDYRLVTTLEGGGRKGNLEYLRREIALTNPLTEPEKFDALFAAYLDALRTLDKEEAAKLALISVDYGSAKTGKKRE